VEKYCRAGQATDDNMAHAHCMVANYASNTHSEYVTLIAFPLQPASLSSYTYTACLVQIASSVRNHTATHSPLPTPTSRNAATKVSSLQLSVVIASFPTPLTLTLTRYSTLHCMPYVTEAKPLLHYSALLFTLASTLSLPFRKIRVFVRLHGTSQLLLGSSCRNCPTATFAIALQFVCTDIDTFGEYAWDSNPKCTLLLPFVDLLNFLVMSEKFINCKHVQPAYSSVKEGQLNWSPLA